MNLTEIITGGDELIAARNLPMMADRLWLVRECALYLRQGLDEDGAIPHPLSAVASPRPALCLSLGKGGGEKALYLLQKQAYHRDFSPMTSSRQSMDFIDEGAGNACPIPRPSFLFAVETTRRC
jgi:hypothetical protein